ACAAYLAYWVPSIPIWAGILLFAALIIVINLASVGSFGVVEFLLSSLKVIAVFVFILVGAVLVFFGLPDAPAPGLAELTADGGFAPNGWAAVWIALSVVMFSFGGIELLSITAAEAKDPARSIRTAARTTVVRLAFFYVFCIGFVLCLVPWRIAAGTGEDVATSPFVMVFDQLGIPGAAHITNLLVLIAALSAANANLYAGSRMVHSLAADGLAPRFAAHTTPRRVPVVGIALSSVGLLGAALLAFSGVGGVFNYMMSLVVFAVILVWALILCAYIAFRRRRVTGATFRMPGGIGDAVVGLIGLAAVFGTIAERPSMHAAALVGVPAVLAATVLYIAVARRRIDPSDIEEAFAEAESM